MSPKPDLSGLRKLLGKGGLLTDPAALIVYEQDAAQERGLPEGVVFPASVEEVCRVAGWAAEQGVPLVARGAGTGLSGGAVAERGGLIVEFSRLKQVLDLDLAGRSVSCQPGITNLELDELVKSRGLYYPPDPASGRSASLGGNVAENAGGPHCFKYGVTTNYITGLEFVAPGGRRYRAGGRALDYPEYDFTCLLTGSEGTLGLVTRIEARLLSYPPAVKTTMAAFDSVEQAGLAVSALIAAGLVPSTLEMMDQKIAQIIEAYAHPGLPTEAGAILIVEVDGYAASLEAQSAEMAGILEANGALSLKIANSPAERDRIWYARKSAAGAMARLAPAYMLLDGTVPRSRLAEALEASNRICERHDLKVGYVFHAGDGNLHPFILMYPSDREQVERVHQAGREFMEEVVRLEGSITGEHGVGIEKRPYLSLMYNPTEIGAMLEVKEALDPQGLLNPGKIFPAVEKPPPPYLEAGEVPEGGLAPAAQEEAGLLMASLARAGQKYRIANMANENRDRAGRETERILSTANLGGLKELAPNDLYVRAGAGMRLADLQESLAGQGKWIAAASPWQDTSLGGLLAENLNAPLRMRYGSLRDQVLEMRIVLGDGRLIRAGRPVVKNVAGYDLARFMVGTRGSLGLIAEVTLKFLALPRQRRSLIVPVKSLEQGLALGQGLLPGAVVASAVLLSRGVALPMAGIEYPGPSKGAVTLTYTAEGHPQDVRAELDLVRGQIEAADLAWIEMEGDLGTGVWAKLLGTPGQPVLARVGLPPRALPDYARQMGKSLAAGPCLYDIGNGFIYSAYPEANLAAARDWLEGLRRSAEAGEGYAVVLSSLPEWEGELDRRGRRSDTFELEQRLKELWDPVGCLPEMD